MEWEKLQMDEEGSTTFDELSMERSKSFVKALQMDNKPIKAAIMGAATTVMAVGLVVLKDGKFRGRKGETSQNVLAAISFDLHFTYVLAGWEGSAHDSRILDHALSRPRGFKVPEGKYYLGDAGYGVRRGIISPYRGTRYHLKEFGNNPPQNKKELFNLHHSSLRSTVERCFGVLKKRFRVIDAEPFWSFKTQVDVVLACCIIHNYVKGVDPMDAIMEEVNNEMARNPNPRVQQTQREVQEENREWVSKREEISDAMWADFIARRNR